MLTQFLIIIIQLLDMVGEMISQQDDNKTGFDDFVGQAMKGLAEVLKNMVGVENQRANVFATKLVNIIGLQNSIVKGVNWLDIVFSIVPLLEIVAQILANLDDNDTGFDDTMAEVIEFALKMLTAISDKDEKTAKENYNYLAETHELELVELPA